MSAQPEEFSLPSPRGGFCPDHPGPLDDATDHVCRVRPESQRHMFVGEHGPELTMLPTGSTIRNVARRNRVIE